MRRLDELADWVEADLRILISRVPSPAISGRKMSCDLSWLLEHLNGLVG
jgi:hypothetical protein